MLRINSLYDIFTASYELSKVSMHSAKKEKTAITSILVESIGDNEFINQIGFSPMERATNV